MNRIVLISFLVLLPMAASAQHEGEIKRLIELSDSLYKVVENTKKADAKVKILCEVINLNDSAYNLLRKEQELLAANDYKTKVFDFFALKDTTVFGSNFVNLEKQDIPFCLERQYQTICTVRELCGVMDTLDRKIHETESDEEVSSEVKKMYIAERIGKEAEMVNNLCDRIDNLGIATLSEEQQKFYKDNLIKRFNEILNKYIF